MSEISLPKPEILTFNSDPKNYIKFIRSFETNIERKTNDDSLKLSYLIQFCAGEAKESIEDCVIMDAGRGYQKAKEILHQRYGRPHIIIRSHLDELVNGRSISPNDGQALTKLHS